MEHPYSETLTECPLCKAGAFVPLHTVTDQLVSQERFHVVQCTACGFAFTNPRPSPSVIGKYYESQDYISHSNASHGFQDRIYQLVRRRAIRGKHRLLARYKPHGRVLDVGCGTGEFLGYLKSKGYLTHGVEPSLAAREQAIALHGADVVPDLDRTPAQEQFHAITLWHVLEHVHDVRSTLKKLHARLSQQGLLLVAVPDRESVDASHYGSQWAAWDVPRHLSHFRRKDMERFLNEQGFTLLEIRSMWFDAPYVAMLSERHRGAGQLGAFLNGMIWGSLSNLAALCSSRPTSSSLFVARKA